MPSGAAMRRSACQLLRINSFASTRVALASPIARQMTSEVKSRVLHFSQNNSTSGGVKGAQLSSLSRQARLTFSLMAPCDRSPPTLLFSSASNPLTANLRVMSKGGLRRNSNKFVVKTRDMSTAEVDAQPPESVTVHDYWFGGNPSAPNNEKWFMGGAAVDEEIRTKFSRLVETALAGDLGPTWDAQACPQALLAHIIVLDQFTRNLHRGTPKAFQGDPKAVNLTRLVLEKGWEMTYSPYEVVFAMMPLMHSESIADHELGQKSLKNMIAVCDHVRDEKRLTALQGQVEFFENHTKVIRRFGRYPSRNKAMARVSSAEEEKYLAEELSGWEKSQ